MNKNVFSLCLVFLSLATGLFIVGCSKGSSDSPTGPEPTTYPSVAPYWKGQATLSGGEKNDLTVKLDQSLEKLSGFCVWMKSGESPDAEFCSGSITASRQITLKGTGLNRSTVPSGGDPWPLHDWTVTMSAGGDTINGSFTAQTRTAYPGTLVLVKQAQTFPTVAASWKGTVVQFAWQNQGRKQWDVQCSISQALDVLIGNLNFGFAKEYFAGSISAVREIKMRGWSVEKDITAPWYPGIYSGVLSARGDSISGSWVDPRGTGLNGTWDLAKQ
jgi:hypothetical protein